KQASRAMVLRDVGGCLSSGQLRQPSLGSCRKVAARSDVDQPLLSLVCRELRRRRTRGVRPAAVADRFVTGTSANALDHGNRGDGAGVSVDSKASGPSFKPAVGTPATTGSAPR